MKIVEYIGYTLSSPRAVKMRYEPLFEFKGFRNSIHASISDCGKILIVKMDRIGDFVLSIPFLRVLRRNLPNAKISIVTQPLISPLLEGCPYVDDQYVFSPCNSDFNQRYRRLRQSIAFVKEKFWAQKFDYAVIPRWDFDIWNGHYLAYLSGARRRAGYSESVSEIKKTSNQDENLFLTDIMKNDVSGLHEVERNLNILIELGLTVNEKDWKLDFWLNDKDSGFAEEYFKRNNIGVSNDVVAVGHGSWESRKRWKDKRFAEVCKWLAEKHKFRAIIFGAPEDRDSGEKIRREAGSAVINSAGEMSLRQVAAVMSRCRLYLGNDTGLKHIAAAVNIPVVEICGFSKGGDKKDPLSPERFRAWTDKGVIVQPDIEQRMDIDSVTTEQVKDAISRMIEKGK